MSFLSAYWLAPLLLVASNIFMITAWYGHLKFKATPLLIVIGVSWLIALPEYILQVPANRIGHSVYSATQLKIMQEIITFAVFIVFSWVWLGEKLAWNHWVGVLLMIAAAFFVFGFKSSPSGG